jgi:hypothetical protein
MTDLFKRRFLAPQGGAQDLYSVRQHVRDRRDEAQPGSVAWLMGTLAHGRYVHGGYPVFWQKQDGRTICYECARASLLDLGRACRAWIRGYDRADKDCARFYSENLADAVTGHSVNWEDDSLSCDDCGKRLESAYGERADREETNDADQHDWQGAK